MGVGLLHTKELVSAVITTKNRAHLVTRAVASALAQSHPCHEIIVVVDGGDAGTESVLRQIQDVRLKVVSTPQPVGGGEARNVGVRAATGDWIAFLDDDDEWLPHKIERQLAQAARSKFAWPILSCRVRAKTPGGAEHLWPRRMPKDGEPLSEYILARNSLTQGEGLVSTTMIVAPRDLLLRVPFQKGLSRHQEWDWLLRASALPTVGLECVFEELAIWYIDENRPTISAQSNWTESYQWVQSVRPLITKRAYASFLMVFTSSIAARASAYCALAPILKSVRKHGAPKPIDGLLMIAMWTVPQRWRRGARNNWAKRTAHA
jgi:glycosyltransferase involved in cell wall biosynthesis